MLGRLFRDHPRSLGMSWAEHGIGAVVIGARMVGAGLACIVHAVVPGWFTETAGRTVVDLGAGTGRFTTEVRDAVYGVGPSLKG